MTVSCAVCVFSIQGRKLSRYGRQGKELVENGGEEIQVAPTSQPHPHPTQYPDPKRPCFDPRGGQNAGVTTYATPPQVAMGIV